MNWQLRSKKVETKERFPGEPTAYIVNRHEIRQRMVAESDLWDALNLMQEFVEKVDIHDPVSHNRYFDIYTKVKEFLTPFYP